MRAPDTFFYDRCSETITCSAWNNADDKQNAVNDCWISLHLQMLYILQKQVLCEVTLHCTRFLLFFQFSFFLNFNIWNIVNQAHNCVLCAAVYQRQLSLPSLRGRLMSSSLRATRWRPSAADWGGGMSVVLRRGSNCPLSRAMDGCVVHTAPRYH